MAKKLLIFAGICVALNVAGWVGFQFGRTSGVDLMKFRNARLGVEDLYSFFGKGDVDGAVKAGLLEEEGIESARVAQRTMGRVVSYSVLNVYDPGREMDRIVVLKVARERGQWEEQVMLPFKMGTANQILIPK